MASLRIFICELVASASTPPGNGARHIPRQAASSLLRMRARLRFGWRDRPCRCGRILRGEVLPAPESWNVAVPPGEPLVRPPGRRRRWGPCARSSWRLAAALLQPALRPRLTPDRGCVPRLRTPDRGCVPRLRVAKGDKQGAEAISRVFGLGGLRSGHNRKTPCGHQRRPRKQLRRTHLLSCRGSRKRIGAQCHRCCTRSRGCPS